MHIDISNGWKYVEGAEGSEFGIPEDAVDIDLPADLLRQKNRNYRTTLGIYGSYYDAVAATFFRPLPTLEHSSWIVLEVEGVNQFAEVLCNGVSVGRLEGDGKHYVDITSAYRYGAKNLLAIKVWAPQMAGRYVGAGIGGGVRVHTHVHSVALREDGIYVTSRVENGKAQLSIRAELCDKTGESAANKQLLFVETQLFNARGKRTSRKIKKYKMKNVCLNTCDIGFRLSRFFAWSTEDPYLYTVRLTVRDAAGKVLDEGESTFGIVGRALSPARGLVLGGRSCKLKGAVVRQDNGILGRESTRSAEEYKLSRIKSIGYNAVRYIGVPSEAVLDTLDRMGMLAEVDLFDVWAQGEFPYDGHVGFAANAVSDCERFVCQLRKHPCVVLYGLNNDAAETYERGEGSATAQMLADVVRSFDDSRPIVVNACERVPLHAELEQAGIKGAKPSDAQAAIGIGREKDLFGTLTASSFAAGDVAGYAYLYPRYAFDRTDYPDRYIVGTASYPARAFDAFEECEKNANVLGEFLYSGADYLGYPLGEPVYENESSRLLPPHCSYCGDLDLTYNRKPIAFYRSIMLGDRSVSCIAVSDPESVQKPDKTGFAVKETHSVWNWPHNLGKPIEIEVYSGGEVVALYRDGKLIGRKLAGRVNKHIATFRTEFYPGTLEAVSYHKGRECSRVQLSSVSAPRAVKLRCEKKTRAVGELLFVEISVTDKEGRVVSFASREVEVTVTGDGKLVALGSADPTAQTPTGNVNVCPVYDGKALAVIKALPGGEGKIAVKVTGDGLLSGKINLKVR